MTQYSKRIGFCKRDRIGVVQFDHPPANTVDISFAKELLDIAIECEFDSSIGAVLLTGSDSVFCCGGDLPAFSEFGEHIDRKLTELTSVLNAAVIRLCRMNKPVIVAVNGTAAGAGVSLSMIGDYVLASDRAKFTLAYSSVGLSPDISVSYFLPRLIGLRRTQEMMLFNPTVNAEKALAWGMVSEVVTHDQIKNRAHEVAKTLVNGPEQSTANIRNLLLESYGNSLETQMELEARSIAQVSISTKAREAIQAFVNS